MVNGVNAWISIKRLEQSWGETYPRHSTVLTKNFLLQNCLHMDETPVDEKASNSWWNAIAVIVFKELKSVLNIVDGWKLILAYPKVLCLEPYHLTFFINDSFFGHCVADDLWLTLFSSLVCLLACNGTVDITWFCLKHHAFAKKRR